MNKSLLQIIGLLLAAVLILSACSGAATENNANSSSGSGAAGKDAASGKQVELSVFAPQEAGIENMDVNKFSKHIEEKLHIKFKWETTPGNAFGDKKQLLLASGDYPALILNAGATKADQIKYGQQGTFIPLNDLIEQYAPNIKQAMEEIPNLKESMTAPDGNIYALPRINECLHCTYFQRVWINKAWLDKLGLDMPTTTDEFYKVLKAFKEQDPNGNGKADEVPYSTSSDGTWGGGVDTFLMNAFIYNDAGRYLSVNEGKVAYSAAQPEWKEGLKYLNKLFTEGLIDKGAFTQNADAVKQLANKPDPSVGVIGYANIGSAFLLNDENPRHKDYVVLPPLKGPNGVQLAGYAKGFGGGEFVITNKAAEEEKIAAIRLADYLFSEEGTVMTTWGFEGKGWKNAEEGQVDYNGNPAKYDVITKAPSASGEVTLDETWWQLGTMKMLNSIREAFVAPEDPLSAGDGARDYRFWLAAKQYEPFAKPEAVYPSDVFFKPEDALTISQIEKTLTDYVKSSMAQFITSNKDIDKDWDSYMEGFKGLQLEQYLKIHQDALDQ
ncbi:ABC transporter substrate-binding protein [Paenibacillus arenilitoris]|uniref:ABC transporter substrate-binding protein n=1 Tax=Paenibacillus arenilitoris TaxID=2772299 RepID=A0A927CSL3_9BACL|nr:ABC transporter substrate-binding protein [Paenibacillus arenilitoris]MBD2870850.1 ABC transporter substrate-binding protein [Paenibacillus arenilitoris]